MGDNVVVYGIALITATTVLLLVSRRFNGPVAQDDDTRTGQAAELAVLAEAIGGAVEGYRVTGTYEGYPAQARKRNLRNAYGSGTEDDHHELPHGARSTGCQYELTLLIGAGGTGR